jgi:hypothetical protein
MYRGAALEQESQRHGPPGHAPYVVKGFDVKFMYFGVLRYVEW